MLHRNRERVTRALAHEETDVIPFDAAGCGGIAPSPEWPEAYREYCQRGEFRYLRFDPPANRERFQPFLPGLPVAAEVSYWGIGRLTVQTQAGHHAGHRYWHPLDGLDWPADLERYPFPNRAECRPLESLAAEVAAAREAGFTVVGNMSQTILETACLLRGMEQLLADFHERPAYIEALFDRLAQWRQFQARSLAAAGVDVLRIGDDIATQQGLLVSVDHYRRFIQPHHAAIIAAARDVNPVIHVLYHSDGNLTRLLPDLIEAGVTAINPVQPECMNLAEVKREFGRRLTLWGCLPAQSLYAHGTAEAVVSNLRDLVAGVGRGGGLVLQFFNMLLTGRVEQNVQSFFAAFHELGWVKK
jgi:uroporphyrinogen decarboxylase